MTLHEIVLGILLSLPPWHADPQRESPEQREVRLGVVATAIVDASNHATCHQRKCDPLWGRSREDLAALLIVQGWWESRYALHVHQDKCRIKIGECDAGRAKSVWQVHASGPVSVKFWSTIGGVEQGPTLRAAWAATLVLSHAQSRCDTIQGTIAMYATGRRCSWKGAADRYAMFQRFSERFADPSAK